MIRPRQLGEALRITWYEQLVFLEFGGIPYNFFYVWKILKSALFDAILVIASDICFAILVCLGVFFALYHLIHVSVKVGF